MPLCSLHLVALKPVQDLDPISNFFQTIQSSDVKPLVISRVIRWIILPKRLSTSELLAQNIRWDLLVMLPSQDGLPAQLQILIRKQWTVSAGIPSRLIQNFHQKNRDLLHPDPSAIPKRKQKYKSIDKAKLAPSSKDLELSPELRTWISSFSNSNSSQKNPESRGAISMLNLLAFKPNMKSSYLKYGSAFSSSVGIQHGGVAKIVGTVVEVNGTKKVDDDGAWDEVALAHYPSLEHFAEMLASAEYQEANKKWRVPALSDTFILCTSEVGVEKYWKEAQDEGKSRSRL